MASVFVIGVSTTEAVNFYCAFSLDVNWPILGNVYTCRVVVSEAGINNNVLETVRGTHLSGKGNADVQALTVLYQNFPIIPKDTNFFFPNLTVIRYLATKMTTITAEDLRPFPKLRVLNLAYNEMKNVDGNLFRYNPNLQLIHLGWNKIDNIGRNAFASLNQLSTLIFDSNRCANARANNRSDTLNLITRLQSGCPPKA